MDFIKLKKNPASDKSDAAAKAALAPAGAVVVPKELELRRMIADANKHKAALEERERPLAPAAAKLELERKALQALKLEVEAAERRAKSSMLEIEVVEALNIKRLAKTWAQMEPLDAAKIIKNIELDFAVKVLGKMTERQCAALLGALTADPAGEKLAASLIVKLKQLKQADTSITLSGHPTLTPAQPAPSKDKAP